MLTVIADAARQALGAKPTRPIDAPILMPVGTLSQAISSLGASNERGTLA